MGANSSKEDNDAAGKQLIGRLPAVGEATRKTKTGPSALPPNSRPADPEDFSVIENALSKTLLFNNLNAATQRNIVSEMYVRSVLAGEILINQGDTGAAASEMYVVKSGEFEVLERRDGANYKVNSKPVGSVFGEVALLYNTARSATVAACFNSEVYVLERQLFRRHVKDQEHAQQNIAVFLNSVQLLNSLSRAEKQELANAMKEETFEPEQLVIRQGDEGATFYLVKDGQASVTQFIDGRVQEVNVLYKADFFGEQALLNTAPRNSTVTAKTQLTCMTLDRATFIDVLGPLEEIMKREKSEPVLNQRLLKLQSRGNVTHPRAEVQIKRKKPKTREGQEGGWEIVRARGHLDEVQALNQGKPGSDDVLVLEEGTVLGGGAFSRVSIVTEESSKRQYALKRMKKTAVVACPEHVLCEQAITRNIAHPFCIRQYASFQDKYHLYFLFDLMSGGDLMDVLVAEAKVVKNRAPHGIFQRACFAPKQKMLQGMDEKLARFYIGCLVLSLEYLHHNGIVYRDLKPENVFIDQKGWIKLGDFGFAKVLDETGRTYTFCGTPGYVAPENVLAKGYGVSVDWWGLGVLLYVLLTGRQPFSSPKTDDAMVVMRRIVDENFVIKYPPYLSSNAKDLLMKLLERKPAKRLGMLPGQANDIKKHPWFSSLDWDLLAARKIQAPRIPKDDAQKRLKDLQDQERRTRREPKEAPEELQECEIVFADF